jgi:hypothetical protein
MTFMISSGRAATILCAALLLASLPTWAQEVRTEQYIQLGNSSQNITSMGLCMWASHQEKKGVTVPAYLTECTNRTWYPYRFIVKERRHLGTYRHVTISLRTRQDLCLDIDPATRNTERASVVMAPCVTTGTDMYQQWGIVPIKAEYSYENAYVLINVGMSSLKQTMVLHAGRPGEQLSLAHFVPGPWSYAESRQYWHGGEFWCQLESGRHVAGMVISRTWVWGEQKPDVTWPHCVE